MSLVVPADSLVMTAGKPKTFTRIADSGGSVECGFCPSCGTRIYHDPERMKGTVNIKPGTLDDTSWLVPNMQVWTRRKQSWVVLPEGTPSFDSQP